MARIQMRLPGNVTGNFYVDDSCIDCDQCRQVAPSVFRAQGEHSVVYQQPTEPKDLLRAAMALLTCPTASIGMVERLDLSQAVSAFPELISDNVYFCGFSAESSFGASSYLVLHPEGNVLIDSPRWNIPLVRKLETLGGIQTMVLSHRDDIADHEKFHNHFGCERVMQEGRKGQNDFVERKLRGDNPVFIRGDFLAIPTPGHTRDHQVFLYQEKYLFTGDHLWWNDERQGLYASKTFCWDSWSDQIRSMEKLLGYPFEWVLPGHGRRHHASSETMRRLLKACIAWMGQQS